MSFRDLLMSALSSLAQHKLRTLLTLCGVVLGALLLFVSLSGGIGVIRAVNSRLGVDERLMEISVRSGELVEEVTVEAAKAAGFTQDMSDERRIRIARASGVGGRKPVTLNLEEVEKLKKLEHVQAVWPNYQVPVTANVDQASHWIGRSIAGVAPNKDLGEFIIEGNSFSSPSANEVVVGELMLYHLGIRDDDALKAVIGSKIKLVIGNAELSKKANLLLELELNPLRVHKDGESIQAQELRDEIATELSSLDEPLLEYVIVGIARTPTRDDMRHHPWFATKWSRIMAPQETVAEVWYAHNKKPMSRRLSAVVRVDAAENAVRLESEISEKGFNTVSLSKLAMQIRTAVLLVTAIIASIAAGALFISGIGITNTMIMNVMERRREIAIMKSIGAQDTDIKRMFLVEGLLIGIIGGLLGLGLGVVLSSATSEAIGRVLESQLKEPFGDQIFAYPWWLIVLTPIVAALVTTIASMLPARQAAKVDPIKALRSL